jgi:coenzyme Q-binding protein COQ10
MTTFQTNRHVPFTARQMFDLVADVRHYPEFLPLCESLNVLSRSREGETEILVCDMTVGYMAIRETFTTRVELTADRLHVQARSMPDYPSGPFRSIDNRWQFRAAPGGCEVEFYIAYEFKSYTLQLLVGGLFDRVFRRYTQAFEQRAHTVYRARPTLA